MNESTVYCSQSKCVHLGVKVRKRVYVHEGLLQTSLPALSNLTT